MAMLTDQYGGIFFAVRVFYEVARLLGVCKVQPTFWFLLQARTFRDAAIGKLRKTVALHFHYCSWVLAAICGSYLYVNTLSLNSEKEAQIKLPTKIQSFKLLDFFVIKSVFADFCVFTSPKNSQLSIAKRESVLNVSKQPHMQHSLCFLHIFAEWCNAYAT